MYNLPGRVFSGKEHPSPDARAVFFCYALPAPGSDNAEDQNGEVKPPEEWTEENGYVRLQTSLDDRFQLAETDAPLAVRQDASCSILHSSPVRHGEVVALSG